MSLTLAEQEAEENFDLALLATLEIDIIPHLGSDARIPDRLVLAFGKCLERASFITADERLGSGGDVDMSGNAMNGEVDGTAHQAPLVPRERFSYWCFDLLILICSDMARGIYMRMALFKQSVLTLPLFRS